MLPIKTILLLNDELDIENYLYAVLQAVQEQDWELVTYTNYDEALRDLDSNKFDLCLVGYNLDDNHNRTGISFIQESVAQNPYLPYILLTDNEHQVESLQKIRAGAVDYIDKKTLKPHVFKHSVRYALRRVETIKELTVLYQQALITNQLRAEMMQLASHDIKNPLSTILMSLEILNRQNDLNQNEVFIRHMARIKQSTTTIKTITEEILSLDLFTDSANFKATNITIIIKSVLRELTIQDTLSKKEVEFIPTQPLPKVNAIPALIREVFYNILFNAIKYTPEGGQIRIKTQLESTMVHVLVTDNGYGIPKQEQTKLFQPYSRVLTDETRNIEGTGMGLYLVKQIIEHHKGRVFVDSKYGEGSTFGFTLPCMATPNNPLS